MFSILDFFGRKTILFPIGEPYLLFSFSLYSYISSVNFWKFLNGIIVIYNKGNLVKKY